jgi:RNase P subunit RPR2
MRNEGKKYLDKVKVKANEKDIHIKTEIKRYICRHTGIC